MHLQGARAVAQVHKQLYGLLQSIQTASKLHVKFSIVILSMNKMNFSILFCLI